MKHTPSEEEKRAILDAVFTPLQRESPVAGSATCSPKLLVTLREVLKLVRRIRDYDPHPSHCDHIHLHATEAIEMLEIAISENAKLSQPGQTNNER